MATELDNKKAEYERHVKEVRGLALAWGLTWIVAAVVAFGGILTDAVQRWGQPLVLEFHTATFVWVVAFALAKFAYPRAGKYIDHDEHHKAEAEFLAGLKDDDEKLGD